MNWFAFQAYNTQTLYGFGSAEEADRFCDKLNKDREINQYAPYPVQPSEAAGLGLEESTESFNIADELVA